MRDVDIRRTFNIPNSTLYNFSIREKGDWRRNIVEFLRAMTKEEVNNILKRIKEE